MCMHGFLGGSVLKNPLAKARDTAFNLWVGKIPWRRKWQPTLVFLPGNPLDRGAWWAAVHGVTKRVRNALGTKQQRVYV